VWLQSDGVPSQLKSKVGNILTKSGVWRINLNIDGTPIPFTSHTHPSLGFYHGKGGGVYVVCMWYRGVWVWGGSRCECYYDVRNTIGRRSRRISHKGVSGKKPWTCMYPIVRNVNVGTMLSLTNTIGLGLTVFEGVSVSKKNHELVSIRNRRTWVWGGCRCSVRNTIGHMSHRYVVYVYYESRKRELKTKLIYEDRFDERLKN